MTTTHDPIDLICGDTWEFAGVLHDYDDASLDLRGAQIIWHLNSLDNSANILALSLGFGITATLDANGFGTINIVATKIQTAAIPPGSYLDWLRITLSDGAQITESTGVIRVAAQPK